VLTSLPGDTPRIPAPRGSGVARAGFTLVELLVVIGIVVVLVGILVPVVGRARASGQSMTCLSNLRQIFTAFGLYAHANKDTFPDPAVTQESWESMIRDYVGARDVYHCPSDGGLFDKLRSSYDWRDTGHAETTIAGRPFAIRRTDAVIVFDALPDWHLPGQINALRANGSVESLAYPECLRDLDTSILQQ
jgi:prepilin-type N-terminal cleavage/methylation domain-containing protein